MKHAQQSGPTQRQLRVGEQLKQIIATMLQRGDFHHEALFGVMLNVAEVRPSPDLKNATVYVSSLGDADMDEVLHALNDESRFFQKEINRQSNMKFTPRIRFQEDKVAQNSARINQLLSEVHIPDDEE